MYLKYFFLNHIVFKPHSQLVPFSRSVLSESLRPHESYKHLICLSTAVKFIIIAKNQNNIKNGNKPEATSVILHSFTQ